MSVSTPVILVVFNRPEVTARNLEVLRAVEPAELFVAADGPRPWVATDAERCAQVRDLLADVGWPCKVRTRFSERNLGLEANVELGLDWVFSEVERAIVLEDDCIADPTFFRFAEELLDRYADDPRVWQIAGDSHLVPSSMYDGASYAFSTWASVWGWATWADRWHAHRAVFPRDHSGTEDTGTTVPAWRTQPAVPHPDSLVSRAALRHFQRVAQETDGDARGWDHHWWVTIMDRQGLSVMPAVNLVENDGYGEDATHTHADKEPWPAHAMKFPLVHPPAVKLNSAVEAELELVLLRTDGNLSRWARRLVRPLWLRKIIRRVVTLPIVWSLVRRVVGR